MAHKDDINQKNLDKQERQKKKSATPQDNYGDAYVDPVVDRKHHNAGKGDKIRDMSGWFNDDVTQTLENIFGKKEWRKKLDASKKEEEETKSSDDE